MAAVSRDGPRAVTFDVWYTLLYQSPRARAAYEAARDRPWRAALRAAGVVGPAADRLLVRLYREAHRRERAGRAFPLPRQVEWASEAAGRRVARAAVEAGLGEAVRAARIGVAPGALGALDRLRAAGVRVGLVSNVLFEPSPPIRDLLERTGLAARAETIVLSSELGDAKPHPRPIRTAARALGVRTAATLHVGDEAGDVLAAWAAGAAAARFTGLARVWPASHTPPGDGAWGLAPGFHRWTGFADALPALYRSARAVADTAPQARAYRARATRSA